MRFLSWECWDFEDDTIISEDSRRSPKSSEDVRSLPKASSLSVLFTSKIRDREEGIVIFSFYTWFSFLTWVWVNIFLEIVSSKTGTTHMFQSGVRNWPAGVNRHEIEVLNLQAWDSRLRRESWQVYSCLNQPTVRNERNFGVRGELIVTRRGKRKIKVLFTCFVFILRLD